MRKLVRNSMIQSRLVEFKNKTSEYSSSDNLNESGEYSKKACRQNPRNYYYRALTYFHLAMSTPEASRKKLFDQVIKNAEAGIKLYPAGENEGHFLIALVDPDVNTKIRHLRAIQKPPVAQEKPILPAYPLYSESQYLLGLLHQQREEKLKAIVAFITAALWGHEEAKNAIKEDIIFDTQNPTPLGFKFAVNVGIYERFKIVQSLYANGVIHGNIYIYELTTLAASAQQQAPVPARTLEKIAAQMVLHSDKNDFMRLHQQNRNNPYINQSQKIKAIDDLFYTGEKQHKNELGKIQRNAATKNIVSDYVDNLLEFRAIPMSIPGWLGPVGLFLWLLCIVAAVAAVVPAFLIGLPLYAINKAFSATTEAKENFEKLDEGARLNQAESKIFSAVQKAATLSIENKGENSSKLDKCKGLKFFNPPQKVEQEAPVVSYQGALSK